MGNKYNYFRSSESSENNCVNYNLQIIKFMRYFSKNSVFYKSHGLQNMQETSEVTFGLVIIDLLLI